MSENGAGPSRRRILQGLGLAPVAAGALGLPQAFQPASAAVRRAGLSSASLVGGRPRVMPMGPDTEDIPIASYNVLDFGATPDGASDSTPAFQAALNAASGDRGAVVFAPAGRYAMRENLSIPAAVTLRGEWTRPGSEGPGQGTVLMAYPGRDNASGTAFITTNHNCTVRDLSIWYPEQNDVTDIHAYPWTIQDDQTQYYNGYYGGNVLNVTLVNSYQGIAFVVNDCHNIRNVYGTCLSRGLLIDGIYDIGRIQNVSFGPSYWAGSGLGQPPSEQAITGVLRAGATGVVFGRVDDEYIYGLELTGYNIGLHIQTSPTFGGGGRGGYFYGQMWGLAIRNAQVGIQLEMQNLNGIAIAASSIEASGPGSIGVRAIDLTDPAHWDPNQWRGPYNGAAAFNEVTIAGDQPVVSERTGLLTFSHSTFSGWGESSAAITATNGSLIVTASRFSQPGTAIWMGSSVASAAIAGNSFTGSPGIVNNSTGDITIDLSPASPADYPGMTASGLQGPDLRTVRRPRSLELYVVTDYGAKGDGVTDDTAAFQRALAAAQRTGGTVYAPAASYVVSGGLTVPSGVELRGTADGPNYGWTINPPGTMFVVTANAGQPGPALITLQDNAGVRGLTVFYPNQIYNQPVVYPPTVRAAGAASYVMDVAIPNGYIGIQVTGDHVDLKNLRGLAQSAFIDARSVSALSMENIHNTMGDWQNGPGYVNSPPGDWWTNAPSAPWAAGFRLDSTVGAELVNCFSFGIGHGLVVTGKTADLSAYGFGVDNSSVAVTVDGELHGGRFANANLVAITTTDAGDGKRYLLTTPSFRGDLAMFGFMGWACSYGCELAGDGSVTIQQALVLKGSVTADAGRLHLDSSFIHGSPEWTTTRNYPQVTAGGAVRGGTIAANVGVLAGYAGATEGFAVAGAGAAALTQSGNVSSDAYY